MTALSRTRLQTKQPWFSP